ncbi:hypothetical protein D6D29_10755 [Aureobasidium pullulans]|nr:hypothetical protein D6D29_10755 [Aureobasidium pullulans]
MKSASIAHVFATAGLCLAFPSTADYSSNSTNAIASYRVQFSHNCPATSEVFPHFTVTNGSVCATQNSSTQPTMQGEERDYTLTYGAEGQSSWTFWIDNLAYSAGPVIRSLVEVTCTSATLKVLATDFKLRSKLQAALPLDHSQRAAQLAPH